jgi:myo-inositol-1(or 4)-monophosphatase
MHGLDWEALKLTLKSVVLEAGALACKLRHDGLVREKKTDGSYVTNGDISVDNYLRSRLFDLLPDAYWYSEESRFGHPNSDFVFMIDPIDGTHAYLDGVMDWTISIAVAVRGEVKVGAVYAPDHKLLFLACQGGGAYLNDRPIQVGPASAPSLSLAGPPLWIQPMLDQVPRTVQAPRIRSLALRIARVAEGYIHAAVASPRAKDWDLAAAYLLIQEAGGVILDRTGNPLRFTQSQEGHGALVAADFALANQLRTHLTA